MTCVPSPAIVLYRPALAIALAALMCSSGLCQEAEPSTSAEGPIAEGVWEEETNAEFVTTRTMHLTLHPSPEPSPALKHRLLPSTAEMLEGNAAVHYLKAMGFLEQQAAQKRIREIYSEASERARRERLDLDTVPPYAWQSMRPEDLPVDEVEKFLTLTNFQRWPLGEAVLRHEADFDRHVEQAEVLWAYLIPEIQVMRELARMQRLRCRVAIAQGEYDEALAILGQQYGMARHLGQDVFVVSGLVGIACGRIAWEDTLHFIRQPDAPNLYWALAAMPDPLVDMQHALVHESRWLLIQFDTLREVDKTPRPAGYWQAFIDRLIPQLGSLVHELSELGIQLPDDPVAARAHLAAAIAASYPGARRYLIERGELDEDQIDSYPTAQIVFMAVLRFYAEDQQEHLKWTHLPYWQAKTPLRATDQQLRETAEDLVGWAALPVQWIGAGTSTLESAAGLDQQIAIVQVIEAIRMHAATNGGMLPADLTQLPVPAPRDPMTGEPFQYRHHGESATLSCEPSRFLRYEFVLRIANSGE